MTFCLSVARFVIIPIWSRVGVQRVCCAAAKRQRTDAQRCPIDAGYFWCGHRSLTCRPAKTFAPLRDGRARFKNCANARRESTSRRLMKNTADVVQRTALIKISSEACKNFHSAAMGKLLMKSGDKKGKALSDFCSFTVQWAASVEKNAMLDYIFNEEWDIF